MRLVESSNTQVSGASKVPQSRGDFFQYFKEVKLVCMRSLISCSRIPAIFQYVFIVFCLIIEKYNLKLALCSYHSSYLQKKRF